MTWPMADRYFTQVARSMLGGWDTGTRIRTSSIPYDEYMRVSETTYCQQWKRMQPYSRVCTARRFLLRFIYSDPRAVFQG